MAAPTWDSGVPIRVPLAYQSPDVEPSLFRNGKVKLTRDLSGSDAGVVGSIRAKVAVPVHNARGLADPKTLERNGFELQQSPPPAELGSFFNEEAILQQYYPACAAAVKRATGAAHVWAFDHNIRSSTGKRAKEQIEGGNQVQGPALGVHGDYTLRSAPERLQLLAQPPKANDTLAAILGGTPLLPQHLVDEAVAGTRRFGIINVWRNIADSPVQTYPMALCDGQTVAPGELVVFEIHYADRVGENYFAKHSVNHQWFTFPQMTKDEILLLKQWDSAGALARTGGRLGDGEAPGGGGASTFSFHTAFSDPTSQQGAPDRQSMEVRCAVFWPTEKELEAAAAKGGSKL